MTTKLHYACCQNENDASAILFGADTKNAGASESYLGRRKKEDIFSGDFVRAADNESPSLPENLVLGSKLFDQGNLNLANFSQEDEIVAVKNNFVSILQRNQTPICLGGDHVIKYSALAALSEMYNDCWIAYIDTHPDCKISKTINYASILHWGFQLPHISPENVGLIGIRQLNSLEADALKHYNPCTIWGSEFVSNGLENIYSKLKTQFSKYKKVYFSIDLDGLDPSSAPAVEAPYPGGPSLNEIIILMRKIANDFSIVGMDISELVPKVDHLKITALTTARLVKEFYSLLK